MRAKLDGNSVRERITLPKHRRCEIRIWRRTHVAVQRRMRMSPVIQPRFCMRKEGLLRLPSCGQGFGSPKPLHAQLSPNQAPEPTTAAGTRGSFAAEVPAVVVGSGALLGVFIFAGKDAAHQPVHGYENCD